MKDVRDLENMENVKNVKNVESVEKAVCAHALAPSTVRRPGPRLVQFYRTTCPLFGPHNSPQLGPPHRGMVPPKATMLAWCIKILPTDNT